MGTAAVIYNSRGGNTKKVAEKIAEGLGAACYTIRDISKIPEVDVIAVGSWVIAGRISFKGARLIRKLRKKIPTTTKIALFCTCSKPDDINPLTEKSGNPKTIKEVMFESMEDRLTKKQSFEILPERFVSEGDFHMGSKTVSETEIEHPSEEDLTNAMQFGQDLRKYL